MRLQNRVTPFGGVVAVPQRGIFTGNRGIIHDPAYTLAHGRAFRWTAHGYEGPIEIPRADALLTPPSTLGALRAGYRPVLPPSVDAMQPRTADA